jgi:hypothetical protein
VVSAKRASASGGVTQQEGKAGGKKQKEEEDAEPVPIKTTLLVVPANLIPQW